MRRRDFATGLMFALPTVAGCATNQKIGGDDAEPLRAIEADVQGRLGVAVFDASTGHTAGWRLDERFPMCSTFKWLLAAAVLQRVDAGSERLERRIVFGADALLSYAPETRRHVGGAGMSVAQLCEAAVTLSDNTAANLLLAALGGPAAVTACARSLGDDTTRLDRTEPALNESLPGDPRDTTSPRAMSVALRRALLGDGLSAASRERLTGWMVATQTGTHRLRAGLPAAWRIGDKTGTGERGSTNDVAVAWPPQRAPLVVVAYLTDCAAPIESREAALARVGRVMAGAPSYAFAM
jgi:beta-lactamase class A